MPRAVLGRAGETKHGVGRRELAPLGK